MRDPVLRARVAIMVAEYEAAPAVRGERGERRDVRRETRHRPVDHVAGEDGEIGGQGSRALDGALDVGAADAAADVQVGNLRDAKALEIRMQARHAKHDLLDARP